MPVLHCRLNKGQGLISLSSAVGARAVADGRVECTELPRCGADTPSYQCRNLAAAQRGRSRLEQPPLAGPFSATYGSYLKVGEAAAVTRVTATWSRPCDDSECARFGGVGGPRNQAAVRDNPGRRLMTISRQRISCCTTQHTSHTSTLWTPAPAI